MNRKYFVLPLLLLLLVGIVPAVSASTTVIFDDQAYTWWDLGDCTLSTDASIKYYGVSSLKAITGTWMGHAFSPSADWSAYSKINFFLYGNGDPVKTFDLMCKTNGWTDFYTYSFVDAYAGWHLYSIPLASFSVGGGAPNWNSIASMQFSPSAAAQTYYFDYIWLSGADSQTLQVLDPTYATLVPVVGNHTYVEGQPVKVTATMLADYTFLKYSFYPVSDSTSNPSWIIMDGNYTLTTVLQAPADPAPASYMMLFMLIALLAMSIIFYLLKMPLFVMVTGVFALLINAVSVGSGIVFTPYIQILFSVIELVLVVYAIDKAKG